MLVNASKFYSQKHRSMAVERRFDPPQVSKMLVKWSKCSSFYSQRTSKKERKSLIISDILVFFLYPIALFTCFLPLFKRKGTRINSSDAFNKQLSFIIVDNYIINQVVICSWNNVNLFNHKPYINVRSNHKLCSFVCSE